MRKISENAKRVVNGWLQYMQDGDTIKMVGNRIIIYSCGCENDSVDAYA